MPVILRVLALILMIAPVAPAAAASWWTRADAQALAEYARNIGSHGLNPADYDVDGLVLAIGINDPAALDSAATRSFALIARDLSGGHVPPANRRLSFLPDQRLSPAAIVTLMDRALATHNVAASLDALAPQQPEYRSLRAALLALPADDQVHRQTLLVNLERWRWLPRNLGARYLFVDIPEFRVRLIDGDAIIAEHRVIVGKTNTPTPQLTTMVTGVILNPDWHVPQSIAAESLNTLVRTKPAAARARGYEWTGSGASLQIRQLPGPNNALGQVKLEMTNPLAIYLHDTPGKTLFDRDVRTFSHGCVRTEYPDQLAATLLRGTPWTLARIAQTIAGQQTTRIALPQPIPAYITYLTARADSGGTITYLADPYGLDAAIAGALAAR